MNDTTVRTAARADVAQMVELSERFRLRLQTYQPVFWRKAEDSRAAQTPYFGKLVAEPNVIALVSEKNGQIDGFVIAALILAPAVYDPGGLTCMIDDFCMASPDHWPAVGAALLDQVTAEAKARGAVQTVIVCPHLDEAKRAFLRSRGHSIASEWYVRGI